MARYKLMSFEPIKDEEEHEIDHQRKKTKAELDQWVHDNVYAVGLDWRVGYTIKFRNSSTVYVWRWIKDNKEVKV